MFKDVNKNIYYLKSSFLKLKSYYYYNKNMLFIKMKIAEFEQSNDFDSRIHKMADFLVKPDNDYVSELFDSISFRIMNKNVDVKNRQQNEKQYKDHSVVLLSNMYKNSRVVTDVNFVIDAPIEILIFDTLWTVILAGIYQRLNVKNEHIYSNIPSNNLFIDSNSNNILDSINWGNAVIFDNYYMNYCKWRDEAFNVMQELYDQRKDSLLFTLDLKSYFYRVVFTKDKFSKMIGLKHENLINNTLSDLIFSTMSIYTKKIKKYNLQEIKANYDKGESLFPIGLLSSLLLSNMYLMSFDDKIKNINPKYYGRYVDDILIVKRVDKKRTQRDIDNIPTDNENLHLDNLLEHITTKSPLELDGDEIRLIEEPNLIVQKNKVKCLHVSSRKATSLFNLYDELFKSKPSILNQSMDFDLLFSDFDRYSQDFDIKGRSPKVRDFANIIPQQNKAKMYIDNAIRCLIGTKTNDNSEEMQIISNNTKEIQAFYDDENSLQDVAVWQSLFYYYAVIDKTKEANQFYRTARKLLKKSTTYDFSKDKYKTQTIRDFLNKKAKGDFVEELDIAYALSIALHPDDHKDDDIYKRAVILRKSNMFRNDLVLYPLLNYSSLNNQCSFSYLKYNDFSKNKPDYKLDENLLSNKPRFISLGELYFYHFYASFYNNVPYFESKSFSDIELSFKKINKIMSGSLTAKLDTLKSFDDYDLHQVSISSIEKLPYAYKKLYENDIKVAVASVKLEKNEVIEAITNPHKYLTLRNKARLFNLVNDAIKNRASILVFPEYYLPKEWVMQLSEVSKKAGLIIVSGMNLIKKKKQVHNYSIIIQPIASTRGHKNVMEVIREKNDYAPEEMVLIANEGFFTKDSDRPLYQVIRIGELSYALMICYELTDIKARAIMSQNTNVLIAVEYNSDTNYYSSLVESYSRDSSSYVIQVNTAQFGDSRITSPSKSERKDIVKVKGGINDTIIVGEINVKELNEHKKLYHEELKSMCSSKLDKNKPRKVLKHISSLSLQEKKYLLSQLDKETKKFKPLSARNL